MGNPNSKNPLLCGERKKSKKVVAETILTKALITAPVINKTKTTRVALTVTDEDVEKLAGNDFAIVKGIQKRSGCIIVVLPKKTDAVESDREIHFSGSELAVAKGKAWIKERLIVSFAIILMILVVSLTHS